MASTNGLHPLDGGPIPSEGTKRRKQMNVEKAKLLADKMEKTSKRMKKLGIFGFDCTTGEKDPDAWLSTLNGVLDIVEEYKKPKKKNKGIVQRQNKCLQNI